MPTAYGFRVYIVQLFPNRAKGNEALDVSPKSWATARLYDLLEQAYSGGTTFYDPAPPSNPDEPAKATTSITVGKPVVVRNDLVHANVSFGEQGSHPHAVRQGRPRRSLAKWSPEAGYYVTFLFPKDVGDDRLIVVAQTVRRRDPVALLFRRLREIDLANKKTDRAEHDARRDAARARGERVPRYESYDRLVFERTQAADGNYIDEILGAAKTVTAEFVEKVESDRGRDGLQVRRKLTIRLIDDSDRDIGRTVGRRWTRKRRDGAASTVSEGVSELGAVLEEHDLVNDGETARYTNAALTVRDIHGEGTRIAVDTLKDVFTYSVSDGHPQPIHHYKSVAPRVRLIAAQERIEVRAIEPLEVESSLADSTSDPS